MYAKHFIYTFLALFTSIATWAQFQFKAEVLNKSIAIDQTTEVRFIINYKSPTGSKQPLNFKQPLFKNFYVVNKMSSNSAQYTNGIEHIEQSHTFVLSPLKTGDLVIESANVTYQGKDYKTKPLIIKVGYNDIEKKTYTWESLGTFKNSIIDRKYFETISLLNEEEKDFDFGVVTNLRKGNIYVNEVFALEYGLLLKKGSKIPTKFTFKKTPSYSDSLLYGKLIEPSLLPQPETIKIKSASRREFNKTDYFYAPLATYYLNLKKQGVIEILPLEFEMETTDTITNIVNTKLYASKNKKIKIIPVKNQPKDFSSVFGDYNIVLYVGAKDRTHIVQNDKRVEHFEVNEPIEILIQITGVGILPKETNIFFPKIISDLEYSLDLKEDYTKGIFIRNNEAASKTYIFTPKQKGKYTISTIDFPYFNTTTNKYTTISTEEIIIEAN